MSVLHVWRYKEPCGAAALLVFAILCTAAQLFGAQWSVSASSAGAPNAWLHCLVHLNTLHLVLNLAGLAAVLRLWPALKLGTVAALWVAYGTAMPMALSMLDAAACVVGLSGLLHAVFAFQAVTVGAGDRDGSYRLAFCSGLIAKLGAEQQGWVGDQSLGWEAHLVGCLCGFGLGLVVLLWHRGCAPSTFRRAA